MKNNCLMLSGIAAFAVFQPDCRADCQGTVKTSQ